MAPDGPGDLAATHRFPVGLAPGVRVLSIVSRYQCVESSPRTSTQTSIALCALRQLDFQVAGRLQLLRGRECNVLMQRSPLAG